ncbi:MAG: SLC13 family permease [Kiloniellales bacterium]|nr:SLC13 family permease [Kiloniellales bacterium]
MPTTPQILLFAILLLLFALLIWGRWRYDLVAFSALVVALVAGVVPAERAFAGFGHPATVVIALVLVVSRGLSNSGVVEYLAGKVVDPARALFAHIAIMSGLASVLSAVMNNVAALALLMPVDLEAAAKAKRSPALTLMPLSFASILGGLVTLIGTPPNIIVATFRGEALGEPFEMFDFTPVGAACALVGVLFVALVGWRLIPRERGAHDSPKELFELEDYVAELAVPEGAKAIEQKVAELTESKDAREVQVLGLIRRGHRLPAGARQVRVAEGDVLVIQAGPEAIEKFAGTHGLDFADSDKVGELLKGDDLELVEVVVPEGARIEHRSAATLRLAERFSVHLLGVSRQGQRLRERVRRLTVRAGDVLLLLGPSEELGEAVQRLGCLPLAKRGLQLLQREKAGLAVVVFAAAIALASFGLVYLPIALAGVVAVYAFAGIVPPRELYDSVEWPVIVLLGALIPIGEALESSGGTALIADGLVGLSAGQSAVVVLALLMVITMTLSDVMNNTATAVIAAPIALEVAGRLGVSPDPFLMAVAVAASCAFLTPIGHKNNTLIMGPGGYRFGDYWRMGLPLELLIVVVSIPMILLVWPL